MVLIMAATCRKVVMRVFEEFGVSTSWQPRGVNIDGCT